MTLDIRARRAAQGIHRAVEVMEMTTTRTPGNVERFDRFRARRSRNRRIAAAVVGVAMTLAVIVGAVLLWSDRGQVAEPVPPTPNPTSSEGPPAFVDLRTGEIIPVPDNIAGEFPYRTIPAYRVSPDGTKLAFGPCCSSPSPTFVANVDGTGVRRVSPGGMETAGASWSPDSSMLVFQGRDGSNTGNLFVVDVTTEEVRQITDLELGSTPWWFTWPSFTPDGRTILFHLPRRHVGTNEHVWDLWSVPVSGGEPVRVRRNAGFGTYSPDGHTIAYLSPLSPANATGAGLWLVDAAGGEPRVLVEGKGIWWPSWSPDGSRIAYAVGTDDIYVVEVATGESTRVSEGATAEWFDDHTLIIAPYCCRVRNMTSR